jgi:hypothetical protein
MDWLSSKGVIHGGLDLNPYEKIGNSIIKTHKKFKIDYETNKPQYAREIVNYIDNFDLNILDLEERMLSMDKLIKQWNSIK